MIFVQPPIALPLVIAAAIIGFWPGIAAVRDRIRKARAVGEKA